MMFPLSVAISFYVEQQRLNALNSSSVKVKANDTLSSTKILTYMAAAPIYYLFFSFCFDFVLRYHFHLDATDITFWDTVFMAIFPIIQLIAVRSHDGARTHHIEFQGRFISLFYPGQVELIRNTRKILKKKIRAAVDKVGPQVFKNFDKLKLVMFESKDKKVKGLRKINSVHDLDPEGNRDTTSLNIPSPTKTAVNSPKKNKKISFDLVSSENVSIDRQSNFNIEIRNLENLHRSETSKSGTNYNLEYKDEIELNQAFNMLTDV
jgi:hypothetical protein